MSEQRPRGGWSNGQTNRRPSRTELSSRHSNLGFASQKRDIDILYCTNGNGVTKICRQLRRQIPIPCLAKEKKKLSFEFKSQSILYIDIFAR